MDLMGALWSWSSLEVETNSQADEEKQASEANGPVRGTQARGFADDHQKNHAGTGPNDQRDEGGDCLLYTSPSPRDRSLSRMPSSA